MKRISSKLFLGKTVLALSSLLLLSSACSSTAEYVYIDDTDDGSNKVTLTVSDTNGNISSLATGSPLGVYVVNDDESVSFVKVEVRQDGTFILPTSALARRLVAYFPYQESWGADALKVPQSFSVVADQTTVEAYNASDLMMGASDINSDSGVQLVHMLAQVVIHIVDETGSNDFENCGMTLREMNDAVIVDLSNHSVTTEPSSVSDIKMLPYVVTDHRLSLKAIVAPQTKEAGDRFLVFTNNGYPRRYSIPQDADMQAGKTYTFSMRMTEEGLEFVGSSISDWEEEDEHSIDI